MAISFVGATKITSAANDSSFTINKPTGVTSGDYMVAAIVQYTGLGEPASTVNPPSGWTIQSDVYADVSNGGTQLTIMTRTAGSSEPGSWVGSYSSNAFMEAHLCAAYRGAGSIASQTTDTLGSGTSYSVGSVTNSGANNWRIVAAAYVSASDNYALETTEVVERIYASHEITGSAVVAGIWDSGNSVSTSSHSRTVSRGAVWASSAAWIGILSASDPTSSGSMACTLPKLTASMSGDIGYTGTMAATLPMPTMTATAVGSPPEGALTADIVPAMNVVAATAASGSLTTVIMPIFDIAAETRAFGIRVITVEAESRRLVPTLGADTINEARLSNNL